MKREEPEYISVRVATGSSRESIRKIGTRYVVSVKEKPEQNLANRRVLTLIAQELGVMVKNVRIVHGHHSPAKRILVSR